MVEEAVQSLQTSGFPSPSLVPYFFTLYLPQSRSVEYPTRGGSAQDV